jgi:hypothetical protein
MHSRHTLWLVLLLLAVSVVACSPKASPQPTAASTPRPTATATLGTNQVPVGFTEDGLPYRGNPNALVTLVEHSEFQ